METCRSHYRVSWIEKSPGGPSTKQTHRYRTEAQALAYIARLRREQPGVRVVLEVREARLGPWTEVAVPKGGA